MSQPNKVTVKITLEVERTLELRQDNKPAIYSNVEWEKQQIEDEILNIEMGIDGRVESQYSFKSGGFSEEIPT